MEAPNFDTIIKEQFKFLEFNYDFHLSECIQETWGYRIIYLSDKVGIKITYEYREAYIFIMIYKLIAGELIENPRSIKEDTPLYGYELDDILSLRKPPALIKPAYKYGKDSRYYDEKNGLTEYVTAFADNLKKYAADILSGNFEVFKELDKIVKERASKCQ